MMMLGDMLAAARSSGGGVEEWLRTTDSDLAGRLSRAAATEGSSVAEFVRIAVADFGRYAGEDDWATLVSRLRDNAEPGTACLVAMLLWRLDAEGAQQTPAPAGGTAG